MMADLSEIPPSDEALADLSARATALYAVKKYDEAAEIYAYATEMQDALKGEMNTENADLLFQYGRCLFHVAQKKSGVLGGQAATAQLKNTEKKPNRKRKANGELKEESTGAGSSSVPKEDPVVEKASVPAADESARPMFQITGDENFADSSDEDEESADEGDDEDEDDFTIAFEVLDTSRVLYQKQLDTTETTDSNDDKRKLLSRLAEIYDLQAEISLENEKFDTAATDLRSCLDLLVRLHPQESTYLAECHFKLSYTLEAASQIQQRDGDGNPIGQVKIDWDLRNEAVAQMVKAVESITLRLKKEKERFNELPESEIDEHKKRQLEIDDVQDMLEAMEQRLEELKKPPISVEEERRKEAEKAMMGSILGSMMGGTAEEQKKKMQELVAGANDLSGMVKRKKPKPDTQPLADVTAPAHATGKRKADMDERAGTPTEKKAKVEDAPDEGT